MKKFKLYLLSALSLFGCLSENISDTNNGNLVFTASFEDCNVRTYLEEGNLLRWNADDRISIFAGSTSNTQYRFDGQTGDNSGTFSLLYNNDETGEELASNYAVYPYMNSTEITESGHIYFYLPEQQTYAENSFGPGANTMVAVTESTDDTFLAFKNVCGYLKIQMYGSGINIRRITFRGNDGEKISGEATINLSDPNTPVISTTRESETSIALDCGEEGVQLGSSSENATAFWLVIPPKTFSRGFSISILTSDDVEIVKSTNSSVTIERNMILPMKAFEIMTQPSISPDYEWFTTAVGDEYYICTVEEFIAWSRLANGDSEALAETGETSPVTFEGKTVNLIDDIDLQVCCLESSSCSWEPIANFMGNFNGNGHVVKNLYCSKSGNMGLFDRISNAVISDLTVEGKIRRVFQSGDGNPNIGGLVSYASNSRFENCVSDVMIETSGSSATCPISMTAGGICGSANSCVFLACSFLSSVNDYQGERDFGHYIAGIVGYPRSSKVIACMNSGEEISQTNGSAYCYVGGVVGYLVSGDSTIIRSCYSSASVSGRQPGQILGAYGTSTGTPNIQNSYYSGSSSYKGVGTKFYGGFEYSYDYGTSKSEDLASEIEAMNATIDQWNTDFAMYPCNYHYVMGADGKLEYCFL